MNNPENILKMIIESEKLLDEESFDFARECSRLLYSDNIEYNKSGREILINILDKWDKIPQSHKTIWTDLIESTGFYPYFPKDENKERELTSTAQLIRKEYHLSENLNEKIYLHEEQKLLYELFKCGKNIIVSAPTSFGKSLLIEEIVASKKFKNIVVIQPTLALLDETRKKLKKYDGSYKLILKTSQTKSEEKGNLFLLTAERVLEYPELPKIDFFVIDEFYKLSGVRDEERSDVLNNAFYLLLKHNAKFYLLGPNIDDISPNFAEKYGAEFYKTYYSLVVNRAINIYEDHGNKFGSLGKKQQFKQNILFELLLNNLTKEQTIIYCSSPKRARKLSLNFLKFLKSKNIDKNDNKLSIIEWIRQNISSSWSIIDCLNYSIGTHDGAMPKHINSSIINYFNSGKLNYLFCTSTIIEGVNTSAKNVVFFDDTKGKRKIDYFDYSNIKGRSGRLMMHFIGKIYNFNPPPLKKQIIIDIPFFEQEPISDEILIQLNQNEIKNKESDQYKKINNLPSEEKEIIRQNGLSVRGQKNIIEKLKQDINVKKDLILWSGIPSYKQLGYVIELAWDNLLKKGESINLSQKQLIKLTFDYTNNKGVDKIIENQYKYLKENKTKNANENEIIDEAIQFSFQILRHWFNYKIPKWFLTIDKLQKYVAKLKDLPPGNYEFFASQIENDFIQPNLSILSEYGIPKSAIKKIESKVDSSTEEDQVIEAVKNIVKEYKKDFMEYEIEKLNENI